MVFPHRQALRAWLLPFRYIDGICLSSYSQPRKVAVMCAGDGRSESGLDATHERTRGFSISRRGRWAG
jgi:hypothetical protein